MGLADSRRNPDGAALGYGTRPEAHLAREWLNTEVYEGFRLADARADDVDLWGGETLLIWGPFSLQSEYMRSEVDTTFAGRRDFDGYYLYASYCLTGESRTYEKGTGVLGPVEPSSNFSLGPARRWGARELALRYSTIDLNDAIIRGGQEENVTFGVNRYLNPNTRVMLNYVAGDIHHDLYEGDLNVLQARYQIDF